MEMHSDKVIHSQIRVCFNNEYLKKKNLMLSLAMSGQLDSHEEKYILQFIYWRAYIIVIVLKI